MSGRTRALLWANLTLVVVDVETTRAPDRSLRIVQAAALVCRNGKLAHAWTADRVNPGVPIDPISSSIHGLIDADVAGAPPFATVADGFLACLAVPPGSKVVLVAHNTSFDVPVLRAELERAGKALPDVAVLDTMGALPALVDVAPVDNGLTSLLAVLHIVNPKRHSAAGDARSTAQAALALLTKAADKGHDDIDALLAKLGERKAADIALVAPGARSKAAPAIPTAHLAGHTTVLAAKPGKRALAAWLAAVDECATFRCDLLVHRVAGAELPKRALLALLLPKLRNLAMGDDAAALATLLGAVMPLLPDLPPAKTGQAVTARRTAALDFDRDYGVLIDQHRRCELPGLCPSCRIDEACPLDTWRLALAPAVVNADPLTDKLARNFFETTGRDIGSGAWASIRTRGHPALADAALRLVFEFHIEVRQRDVANILARHAVAQGCADPVTAARLAHAVAASSRTADLQNALAVALPVLAKRRGSTEDGWRQLANAIAYLRGRLARGGVRFSGRRDAEGNPIPVRRHHPAVPRRTRPARFLRPEIALPPPDPGIEPLAE